jgi:pyruvate/2-oxoglutarate dehydrogenase complex dihydrolipoamide dehydrogenase (E3) component
MQLSPADLHNQTLVRNVHPADWKNPTPASRYNLVVLGGGTAGLVSAAGAAGLGARVALVERHLLGGDCLNVGCVPSKTLLRSAHAMAELKRAAGLGIRVPAGASVDFAGVMERVRRVRAGISPHDSAARFAGLGVDVFLGEGRFVEPSCVEVGGQKLRFARAVIATGARARVPSIPGLAEAGPMTNEDIFNLTERPARLAVIGGGPIGCELAQAFQRLGSEVVLLHNKGHVLDREEPPAATLLQQTLLADGLQLLLDTELQRVENKGSEKVLFYTTKGQPGNVTVDAILLGAGRAPNVDGLNLSAANIAYDRTNGVQVDDFLRTSNPRVYACGDVCMAWKFTHAADFAARLVIQNALFSLGPVGRRRLSALLMPWCTYTEPEVARVGLSTGEAAARGLAIDTYHQPFTEVDRALTDAEEGFVQILTRRGTPTIVGATIVGRHAGELISEVTLAMSAQVGLGRLANVIHPYPTVAEAIRKCGDQYNRTRLTAGLKRWLERWMSWRRG